MSSERRQSSGLVPVSLPLPCTSQARRPAGAGREGDDGVQARAGRQLPPEAQSVARAVQRDQHEVGAGKAANLVSAAAS